MAAARTVLAKAFSRSANPTFVRIPRRSMGSGGDHHGQPKVNIWEDPLNPARWKEEHFVLASLAGWGLLVYGGFKLFGGKKDEGVKEAAAH